MNNSDSDWVDEPLEPKRKIKGKQKMKPKKKQAVKVKSKKFDSNRKITVNFKILPSEARAIKLKARELTKGNVTQMVRLAVLAWQPSKRSLEGIRKTTRA